MDSKMMDLLATTLFFYAFAVGPIVITLLSPLFVIYSPYRWILLLYLIWIWKDRKTAERGGRGCQYVRGWKYWKHMLNYFQVQYIQEEGCKLDPKRNYLLCGFPHGIIPFGILCLMMNSEETNSFFPFHRRFLCTLSAHFYIPFTRDLSLLCGFISASEKSLKYNLTAPSGGNIVCLTVGGVSEVQYCKQDMYKLVLKNRKGFVRVALETGAPLLPTISFNETSVFDQFSSPIISVVQEYWKKIYLYIPVLIRGNYLIFPRRVPITVLVGKPIEVEKNPCPTNEEIDELHQLFVEKLTQLFETHKHKYIRNASDIFIEII